MGAVSARHGEHGKQDTEVRKSELARPELFETGPNAKRRKLSEQARHKLIHEADTQFCLGKSNAQVRSHLALTYTDLSAIAVKRIVMDAHKMWREDIAPRERRQYRQDQRKRLLMLWDRSLEAGKIMACVRIEELLAKLDDTLVPDRLEMVISDANADYDERSIAELNYFSNNGYWAVGDVLAALPPDIPAEVVDTTGTPVVVAVLED